MKIIQKIYASIEQFFFKEDTNGEFLVFFRMAVGLVAGLHFMATIQDFDILFTSKSLVPQDIMTVFHPDWLVTYPKIVAFFAAFGIQESMTVLGTKCAYLALCLLIIGGFYSRIAAFCLMILQVSIMKGGSFFIYGADFFTSMSLFYLILFPSDNYFSLRNYFAKRATQYTNLTPIKRLFQVHLSMAYGFSGLDKLLGFNWRNGESIWKAINLPYANHDFYFDFSFFTHYPLLLVFIGWATIAVELLYPVFIWIPATRKTWMLFTIGMHIGIALVLNLYFFSAIMIVWNLSNFYFDTAMTSKKVFPLMRENSANELTVA